MGQTHAIPTNLDLAKNTLAQARQNALNSVHHEWQFAKLLRDEFGWGMWDAKMIARKIWLLEAVDAAKSVEDLGFILERIITGD